MIVTSKIFNAAAHAAIGAIYLTRTGSKEVTEKSVIEAEGRVLQEMARRLQKPEQDITVELTCDFKKDVLHNLIAFGVLQYACMTDLGELGVDLTKEPGGDGSLDRRAGAPNAT